MSNHPENFPSDAQLNSLGKILVLTGDHGLTDIEVTRLARATSIKFIDADAPELLPGFISAVVSRWLETEGMIGHCLTFKAYQVFGSCATSALLKIKIGNVLLAVELDASKAKWLHNATLIKSELLEQRDRLNRFMRQHGNVVAMLEKCRTKHKLEVATKQLQAANERYGEEEMKEADRRITEALELRW